MARYDKDDLWIFTYENKKARFKDYEQYCKNGRFQKGFTSNLNKQKMNQYLKELRAEKKIVWGVHEEKGFKYSYVPEDKIEEVKTLRDKRLAEIEFLKLSVDERAKIVLKSTNEMEKEQIIKNLALNGWLSIQEITVKTGLAENQALEALWSTLKEPNSNIYQSMVISLVSRGFIDTDPK